MKCSCNNWFRRELFPLPKWIYTEINTIVYWVHLLILATATLGILELIFGVNMFTFWNIIVSTPILAVGDTLAHSVLRMQ